MDDTSKSNRNATKTDLTLLLECLKYQMDWPDSQKQALLTIYSICQQREENVDLFRNMGGVLFVYNLSESSAHCEVKETALFTLGMLAENNVYCKQALCRKETFSDLADCLTRDCPLTLKRVSVYLLSVLVANNRSGQTFAQSSGCLDILLDLFRTRFPLSSEASAEPANISQLHQLWKSVSSALCGCVNNPQNEESQMICVSAFPQIRVWLQQMALPRTELVQPICFFITMTVSNNNLAQENFSSMGGLETLTLTLIRVSSNATQSPLACELSCIMAKTLSACISDNPALASILAQHHVVEQLLPLLTSPNVDPRDQLSVILALGHCTEACEEHQSQLVQCGGLSVIISVLTDAHNEEVRKAATFLLHTCKQATVSLRGPALGQAQGQARQGPAGQGQAGQVDTPEDREACWRSAREMLHKIKQFEREQPKRRYVEDRETPEQQTLKQWLADAIPSPLSPPLMSHPAPVPQWVGRAQGGEPGRGKRNHRERERGRRAERTPVPTTEERSDEEGGGRKRGKRRSEERREEMTPCGPMPERRGRPDRREDQREGRQQHGVTEPNSVWVRRQIFHAGEEPHEALSKERGRAHTHSHSSQRRENDSGLPVTSAQTEAQTEAGARAERPTERDTHRGKERGQGCGRERPSSYPHAGATGEQVKHSAPRVRTHAPAEHYGMAEPTRTHATSAPAAHAAAGYPGQPPVDREERCSVCRGTGSVVTSTSPPLEGARKTDMDSLVFKLPLPAQPRAPPRPKNWIDDEDVLSLCSELLDSEINKILETPQPAHKPSTHRCSGCVLRFSEVSSRTFPGLQRSCHHSCDLHAALLEASDRYRRHLHRGLPKTGRQEHAPTAAPRRRDTLRHWDHCTDIRLTPIRIGGLQKSLSTQGGEHRAGRYSHIRLTPLKKPVPSDDKVAHMHAHTHTHSCSVVSTPDQKTHHGGDSAIDEQQTHLSMQERPMTKRERKNFSHEEVCYLLSGVKKFGPSWNSILWAYPFHPGRNNVDLAMKHRRLQIKGRVQDVTYPRDPGATHSELPSLRNLQSCTKDTSSSVQLFTHCK